MKDAVWLAIIALFGGRVTFPEYSICVTLNPLVCLGHLQTLLGDATVLWVDLDADIVPSKLLSDNRRCS